MLVDQGLSPLLLVSGLVVMMRAMPFSKVGEREKVDEQKINRAFRQKKKRPTNLT